MKKLSKGRPQGEEISPGSELTWQRAEGRARVRQGCRGGGRSDGLYVGDV